jgi:hypothetical protein
MKTPTKTILGCIGLIALFAPAGCWYAAAGGAAAAGTGVAYMRGDQQANVQATPSQIILAAKATMKDMGMKWIQGSSTSQDGLATCQTADETTIRVIAHSQGDGITSLAVRVGTFGDQDMSRAILDGIMNRL